MFDEAFEWMIKNEGGYVLHTVAGDRGGQTYAGISRVHHSNWQGWRELDAGQIPNENMVRVFYRTNYWDRLNCYQIDNKCVAITLFDTAVNIGTKTAAKLAQIIVNTAPDGVIGPITIEAINNEDADLFLARYTIAKIARYADIVNNDPTQKKFLLGWINRALKNRS
jgi:lysozyme family protein